MRLYDTSKLIRKEIDKRVAGAIESRDALVHSVDPATKTALVYIQGSSKPVRCWYPENWEQTPQFLKPGNAVRISHTGGVRGRLEIVGHGQYLPTLTDGGGIDVDTPCPDDGIVSGLQVSATNPVTRAVMISSGSIQMDCGTVYPVVWAGGGSMPMGMGSAVVMGTYIVMGGSGGEAGSLILPMPPQPALPGKFRYDLIVISKDCVVDIVSGTESGDPEMPATPTNHIVLNWVLRYPAKNGVADVINPEQIGALFAPQQVASLSAVASPASLGNGVFTSTITITAYDQYGSEINIYSTLAGTFVIGNGTLDGQASCSVVFSNNSSKTVEYRRLRTGESDPGEVAPYILFKDLVKPLFASVAIELTW